MNRQEDLSKRREALQRRIAQFELTCRRREDPSSSKSALETLEILHDTIALCKTSDEVEKELTSTCKRLQTSIQNISVVANMCNRTMDILSEELNKSVPVVPQDAFTNLRRSQSIGFMQMLSSIGNLPRSGSDGFTEDGNLKRTMLESIREMIEEEIPAASKAISKYAMDYVHDGDIILTIGSSSTVGTFLEKAAKVRRFGVLVLEHAPMYDGVKMVERLRAANVDCTVIPDSAVFAVMPRVTKVICPVRSIFADGTLVTTSFMHSVALAAKHFSKPLVILYWKNKLTDRFWRPGDSFTMLSSPYDVVPMDDIVTKSTIVLNPDGECFSGDSATLFINENGPHDPADVFPIVQEFYRTDQ